MRKCSESNALVISGNTILTAKQIYGKFITKITQFIVTNECCCVCL